MKHLVTLATVLLVSCIALAAPTTALAEDLAIDPLSWDAGAVDLGSSATQTFALESVGSSDVSVYLIQVRPDESGVLICGYDGVVCDFAVTAGPTLPLIMPPGATAEIDVTFTPSALGPVEAYLYVRSNDTYPPPGSVAYIPLTGEGVEPPVGGAAELMDELLEYFEASVDAGDLWGIGRGRSAPHRLDAFRAHLLGAAYLIEHGADDWACITLAAARAKADGECRPPDFVAGPATEDVVTMIDGVMDALGCD